MTTSIVRQQTAIYLEIFVYLQLLDFMTTMVGLYLGASEASPFIRSLMSWGPALGLMSSKLIALTLAGFCLWSRKHHIIRWINYWFAAVVVWNLCVILVVAR